ncbi:LysM peptidoglycan-binding domain-containing protein [Achromobacter kerstersii]
MIANWRQSFSGSQYTDATDTWRNRDYWYGYDSMNRQTTVEAVNANLEINAAQGHKLTYDANGNRLSDQYWDKVIYADGGTAAGFTTETYSYDSLNRLTTLRRDGQLLDARYYDGADRVVMSGIDGSQGKAFFDRSGLVNEQKRNMYDAAGRLANVRVLHMGAGGLASRYNSAYTGYDQAGNVTQYRMDMWEGTSYTNTYTYTHARYEGYREATLSGVSTELDPGQTTYQYDVNGNMVGVVDSKDSSKNQTLINDVNGKILMRVQNGTTMRSLVVNGELMGTTGPSAGADDFSPTFRPIDGGNPSASPGSYRIQAGDTLQTIAQQAYGDSRLWYLIAEANGLASDRDLRVGATVTIPNRVTGNHNDYKTFKPYDPGKLIGDTQPTMPVPEADSGGGGGCGGIGKIFVAVVAVVATVFTAGLMAPAAVAAAAAVGTTTALGATMAAGVAALTGAVGMTLGAGIGIGLVAGAVGSAVSQGVGMAIGAQSKFSWTGVALGGISAAATAGVAVGSGGTATLSSATGSRALQLAERAMVSSTITQGVAMATGLQSEFSWTNVAAAGIGAGVGSAVASSVIPNASSFGEKLTRGFVAGAVGSVAASVLSGGKANYVQVAVDAFGNALGNSVVESMQLSGQPPVPTASVERQDQDVIKQRFRAETMADIRASAVGDAVSDFNDVSFLKELSRGADGGIVWSTDPRPTSFPVTTPSDLLVGILPPIESSQLQAGPQLEGITRTLAEIEAQRQLAIAGYSKEIDDPKAGLLQLISNRSGRAYENAKYDLLASGVSIYGLATDEAFRGQAVASVKSLAEQVANDPVGSAKAIAATAGAYWDRSSPGQIAEDVSRLGLGSLATGGVTAVGAKAIGVVGEGALAAGRQLAPVAADMVEAALRRQGLALGVLPDDSKFLVGSGKVPHSAVSSTIEVADSAAPSGINPRLTQRLDAWRTYQERGGQFDMSRWVQQTQGAPWGTGFKSGYGDWISSVESVHGNSLLSTRPTTLYRLFTDEGTFLKWGISQDMNTRYSGAFMADKQIFGYANGARADLLKLERSMVETQPGPLNLEPWAGIRRKP